MEAVEPKGERSASSCLGDLDASSGSASRVKNSRRLRDAGLVNNISSSAHFKRARELPPSRAVNRERIMDTGDFFSPRREMIHDAR